MSEKHLLVQGGTVYCSQSVANNSPATAVPVKVTSQTLVDANGGKPVATEKDNTVANMNFGACNDPKYRTPPPCQAKVQWTKMYEGVFIDEAGLHPLTEESEGLCTVCSIPGKIKVGFHGQKATITAAAMREANPRIMEQLNPLSPPLVEEEETIALIQQWSPPSTVTIEQIKNSKIR